MKKQYYFLAISALTAIVIMPAIIMAQMDETASSSRPSIRAIPAKIRQEIRTDIQERQDNAKTNQNYRNNLLGARATSSRAMPYSSSSPRMMSFGTSTPRMLLRAASTTPRMPAYRTMPINTFNMRKGGIVNELEKALSNLHNIRDRIESRINKVASSTITGLVAGSGDMTETKRLLSIADAKILVAQDAINTVDNLETTSTISIAASGLASSTIDLNKPRLIASAAQNAIKDAQKALDDVVVAIAHAMGVKLNSQDATSTQFSGN